MPWKLLCCAKQRSLGPSLGPTSPALDLPLCHVLTLSPASSVSGAASLYQASSPSLSPSFWQHHPELFRGQLYCSDISIQEEPNHRFLGDLNLESPVKCWEEVLFITLLQGRKRGVFTPWCASRACDACRIRTAQAVCVHFSPQPRVGARAPGPTLCLRRLQHMRVHTGVRAGRFTEEGFTR